MNLQGVKASKGYAIGIAYRHVKEAAKISQSLIQDVEAEVLKLQDALTASRKQIEEIRENTLINIGKEEAAVFESHLMILDDPEFADAAVSNIREYKIHASKAIHDITQTFLAIFESIEDEYMRERAADIKDVSTRVINNLSGIHQRSLREIPENTIIIAHDLTPSDTAQLDPAKTAGFVTCIGGKTSHSAIMARALEIPAVVGVQGALDQICDGDKLIIDGSQGIVIIHPTDTEMELYRQKQTDLEAERNGLSSLVGLTAMTKAGKKITVAGNIGSPKELANVLRNGGDGIGLFRTEFLFMDRPSLPTEEEQFESYKTVAERMQGKPVLIRTLDIGGDKKLDALQLDKEENPFLGYRAIRICLDRIDLFRTQLRAILRASHYGKVQVMFPMISSVAEFLRAKDILQACMLELEAEGIPYDKHLEVGIMVEIPSAAIMADEFAKHVDFFSIGTNDLTQYTLAVDRMNEKISPLYDSMHPAVLRLIRMTISAAHANGKWCGMCGELAGDENAIPLLLEYGLDEFSMNASSILRAKQIITEN